MPDFLNSSQNHLSLRRLLLRNLAFRIFKHPYLGLLFVLLLTFASVWSARQIEVEANLRSFVPLVPDEEADWAAIRRINNPNASVFVSVELETPYGAKEPDVEKVSSSLREAWLDPDYIASVDRVEPPESGEGAAGFTEKNFIAVMQPGDVAILQGIANPSGARSALEKIAGGNSSASGSEDLSDEDPLGFFQNLSRRANMPKMGADIPTALLVREPAPSGRTRLLFRLQPVNEHSDLGDSIRLNRFLDDTADAIKGYYPRDLGQSSITYFGRHIETASIALLLKDDLARSVVILVLCLFLLMILAFRKIESIFFIVLPSCVGLVWTLGLLSCFTSSITLLTAVFVVLLMVPGLEYAIQMYHRFSEELYRERDYYRALSVAYTEAGRGVVVCSLVTFLIFLSLYLSSFQNLREIALAGAFGIISITAAILLILPVMAALKSRMARRPIEPLDLYGFGLKQLSAAVITAPRTALALGLIITAYLAHHSGSLALNRDIGLDLAAMPRESSRYLSMGPAAAPESPFLILLKADTLQGALELNDRLYSNLTEAPLEISPTEINSISPMLPSMSRQSEIRKGMMALDLGKIQRSMKNGPAALKLGNRDFKPFMAWLRQLQETARFRPYITFSSALPASDVGLIQKHLVSDRDRYLVLTSVYPHTQATRTALSRFAGFAAQASKGIDPGSIRFDSESLQNRRVANAVLYSMAIAVFLAIISLLICLLPHFRWRLELVFLAVLPMACAMVWTLGLLAFLRFEIGLYTLLIFPLLVGIGLNQSVLLMQRLQERRYASLRQVLRLAGRPSIISALALITTFGCLGQTGYDPLQETALVAGAAIGFCAAITLIFIPALLQIRQEGGLAAWVSGEED